MDFRTKGELIRISAASLVGGLIEKCCDTPEKEVLDGLFLLRKGRERYSSSFAVAVAAFSNDVCRHREFTWRSTTSI
jgi:hypothetical protein